MKLAEVLNDNKAIKQVYCKQEYDPLVIMRWLVNRFQLKRMIVRKNFVGEETLRSLEEFDYIK